jgi:L-lactate dehydrogenase complex protein LldE
MLLARLRRLAAKSGEKSGLEPDGGFGTAGSLPMAKRVSLFVTCIVDQVYPEIGLAAVAVLERIGYEVGFPRDQTCCGQPAFNAGYRKDAARVACRCLQALRDAEYVVVPSGSCAAMIKHHFEKLFAGDAERLAEARQLAPRVWEFSQFLLDVAGVEDVGARYEGAVTFHDSCHGLRALKIKAGPRRLLAHVKGLTLKEMDAAEECCGFGGVFSVKFAGISGAMTRTKIASIQRTGAGTVVGVDAGCLMQIGGALSRAGLPIRTMHLAQVLASR